MITFGALLPHPPIIVAGIGKPEDLNQVSETISSIQEVERILATDPPETIVIFTPHGTVFGDAIVIYGASKLSGNLGRFGLNRVWEWDTDLELTEMVMKIGQNEGLPIYVLDKEQLAKYRPEEALDHGVLVPLSFFNPTWAAKVKLVVIPLSYLPHEELYKFGTCIREASERLNRRIAVIASGDLSHCLIPGAPAGYDARGAEFDRKIVDLLKKQVVEDFFDLDPVFLEKAAECGFRSLIMLLGVFDRYNFKTTIHSYEGPFGVGYAVVSFKPSGVKDGLVSKIFQKRQSAIAKRRQSESSLVKYARGIVEAYVKGEEFPAPQGLESFVKEQAGVFVSIKKHGQLRGCIGTTEPTQANLLEEVKQNAISASTKDPRFDPISAEELVDLVYSVDVLKPAESISSIEQLDPKRYGVIVTKGFRRGLLLPNLEGIETAAEQVAIARRKAGIGANETVSLERFEVIRYT